MSLFEEFYAEPAKEQPAESEAIDQFIEMIYAEKPLAELETHLNRIKKEQFETFQKTSEKSFNLKTYSTKYRQSLLAIAIKTGRLDVTKLLIKHIGVNPQNEKDQREDPLLLAYQLGNFEIVDFLLDRNAERTKLIEFLLEEKLKIERIRLEQEVLQSKAQMSLLEKLKGKAPKDIEGTLQRIQKEEHGRLQSMSDNVLLSTLKTQKRANLSQTKLTHKFRKYLELMKHKKPYLYPEPFFTEYMNQYFVKSGFCNGYSSLWLYKTAHGMEEQLLEDLSKISLWDESEDGLEGMEQIFEGIINDMTLLYNPGSYFKRKTQESFEDVIDIVGKNKIKEAFTTSALMTKKEIATHLPGLIPDGMMVKLSCSNHAIACIKEGDRYKIMDPNNPEGPIYATSAYELAARVQEFLLCNPKDFDNFYNEITLSCYSKNTITKDQDQSIEIAKKKAESLNDVLLKSRTAAKHPDPLEISSVSGVTGLLLACQQGDMRTVKWFLDHKANPRTFTAKGDNALSIAAQNGVVIKENGVKKVPILDLLLTKINDPLYCAQPAKILSPLETAIHHGRKEAVERMIEEIKKAKPIAGKNLLEEILNKPSLPTNPIPLTPLFRCIKNNHFNLISLLVDHGADINGLVRLPGKEKSISPLLYAIRENKPDAARALLLCKGIQINEKDPDLNPLFQAVKLGRFAIAEKLVKSGAIISPGILPLLMDPLQSNENYSKSTALFNAIARTRYKPTNQDVKEANAILRRPALDKLRKRLAKKTFKIYEYYQREEAAITPQKDSRSIEVAPKKEKLAPSSPEISAEISLRRDPSSGSKPSS